MQCLVLAGGLGTRMQHLSQGKPKALLELGNQTFIEFQLRWLKLLGISHAVLCLGFKSDDIENQIEKSRFKNEFPQISYSFDGKELVGTGGAILRAESILENKFFVTYGDTVLFLNLHTMLKMHSENNWAMTMAVLKNQNRGDKSNVRLQGDIPFYDKANPAPDMDYIDYGMILFGKKQFLESAPKGKFDLAVLMNDFCKQKKAGAYVATEIFQEIGSPDGYQRFQDFLKQFDNDIHKIFKLKVG